LEFNKIFQTLIHLKIKQVWYQVKYRYFQRKRDYFNLKENIDTSHIAFAPDINSNNSLSDEEFSFLNLKSSQIIDSSNHIDWNYNGYGKLWTYNLNYFDYLQQEKISREKGLKLLHDFCAQSQSLKDAYEPYPISLRTINWVKFLSKHRIHRVEIKNQLYQDVYRLYDQIEYHILANHLFENGFGLLFASFYFRDEKLYSKAHKIINSQLKEQILDDGAHYELAPMYHHIILHRILDSYNLVSNNNWKNNQLENELKDVASSMLGWLEQITFRDGTMPMLNDSAPQIAPDYEALSTYADRLGITSTKKTLKDSGYRKWNFNGFECIIDIGQISPSYQPGHAHADSLQFILNYKSKPMVVDTGISTYEKNDRRHIERSTSSHNTVTIDNQNSSEVWSGFRVGRRAKVVIEKETDDLIKASHNGYRNLKAKHTRIFKKNISQISIVDVVSGKTTLNRVGHIHFHPDINISKNGNRINLNDELVLNIDGCSQIEIEDYQMAKGYNSLVPAQKIKYYFQEQVNISFTPINGNI
tara:strand:+ start:97183 stop:98769 length:1587 start_codon:yes stop_codon:yes gene_type:complete